MENKNNHAPKAVLYAPPELLKRLLPSRERMTPEELAEYYKEEPKKERQHMKTISKYEAYTIKALRTMGVREDLAGFDYTVEAVRLVLEGAVDRPIQWTKKGGVYEKVAETFGMSDWHAVERCIRYTIDMLKREGDARNYRKVLDVAADSSMNVGAYTSAVVNYVRLQAYEENRMVDLSPAIGYAQKGMTQVLVTGRDMDVQLLTPEADAGVIVPEDKAESGVFIADGETEDGMTILTSVEDKAEPKGWMERE